MFERMDGFWSSDVYYLPPNSHGFIWLSLRDLLSRFRFFNVFPRWAQFAGGFLLLALNPYAAKGQQYQLRRYGVSDGLAHGAVHSIYQDRKGYIWFATREGLTKTVADAESILGLDHVRVIHSNDSKGALGSHIDRHANIGEGYIGLDGFRRILTHPRLRSKAFILETPVDKDGDDRRNVEILKSLCRKLPTTTTKSS